MGKKKRRQTETVVTETDECPCGVGATYGQCCQLLHDDSGKAHTAEAVMRARYSAHVVGHEDYLQRSWHPDTRPPTLAMSDTSERWLGLDVIDIERGGALDAEGFVAFEARFQQGSVERALRERSRFVRLGGRWVYYDGELDF